MPTKIEWAEESWNPITGCTRVSEGCRNCYAERMARRLAGRHGYPEAPNHFDVTFHKDRLDHPYSWRKSRMIFVCSMGDLFHKRVSHTQLNGIFYRMMSPTNAHHTFLLLTKRPDRMQWYIDTLNEWNGWGKGPSNIWLGVSVENQAAADERREYLRQTPAAIKYVSYEPALGPVDWTGWEFVDQIISGGEGGPKARPSHPDWHRATRDFCQQHNIAYFFKQHGAWTAEALKILACNEGKDKFAKVKRNANDEKGIWMARVGKKEAGRLLDGGEWNEFPNHNKLVVENHSPINDRLG